jgi:L,D-transpeptidase catalytic domain
MDKTSLDKSLPASKEKKETRLVKTKKKAKKKTSSKRKIETSSVSPAAIETAEKKETTPVENKGNTAVMNVLRDKVYDYAVQNDYSTKYCFLIDMSLPSGRDRFFVYDLEKGTVAYSGLVAHGSCNETFLSRPKFSNSPNCGCSSLGKYKVGEFYRGKYGNSIRLYGLDNSNSNAYKRGVVIHGYDCVPDDEIYPMVLCNSQGCPMVSYRFFNRLSQLIKQSEKPIVLWIYR